MALVQSVFGGEVDCSKVRVKRRRWLPFQPVHIVMAPCGHLHFHPASPSYREDFAAAEMSLQGLFIHEMTHVWQAQHKGRYYLPLLRHPFCRYDYVLKPGQAFDRYGIEQQAEMVRHAFLLSRGRHVPGAPSLATYEGILPFGSLQSERRT